ncbi:MAG: hypothetical protein HQ513_10825 [Rhodospirillales bacterium]|nr:hypothetical protein [Rhodospirillales bacterium]
MLAHLTREEAEVLHAITDGGSINPKTGLLEFWEDHPGEMVGGGGKSSANGRDSGGRLEDLHNKREAQAAASHNWGMGRNQGGEGAKGNALEPFGGSGADVSGSGLNGKTTADPEPDRTQIDRLRTTLARRAKKEEQQKTVTAHPNLLTRPQVNTLEDLHAKKEDDAAKTHNWDMQKQTRPSITQQVNNVKKAREETKKAPAKSVSKPATKNKPSINEANFGNPEPEFTPAKGLIRARKFAQYGVQIGAAVPSNPYMSTAVASQIGALLGAYIGLMTGSFGNRTSTELRDPNTGA